MVPHDEQLLTDKQLREASAEQINDLIARIDLLLQRRGEGGLVRRPATDRPMPADPLGPGTLSAQSSLSPQGAEAPVCCGRGARWPLCGRVRRRSSGPGGGSSSVVEDERKRIR